MKLELKLKGIKPLTLNHYQKISARGKFVQKYKPKASKDFDEAVLAQLLEQQGKIDLFNLGFDPKEHYLSADYRFYFPIFTKAKTLSKTAGDVDNFIKPVQDLIFSQLTNCDDSAIVSTSAIKVNSEKLGIFVTYDVKSLTSIL